MYAKDHVKRDQSTGTIAVRTGFDDTLPEMAGLAWTLVGGNVTGAKPAPTSFVDTWDDLYTPPEPASES